MTIEVAMTRVNKTMVTTCEEKCDVVFAGVKSCTNDDDGKEFWDVQTTQVKQWLNILECSHGVTFNPHSQRIL